MAPKSSNKNTVKNIHKVDVDFEFDEYADRTFVNKDKFPQFSDDYNNSQENSSLSDSSEVQFRVKTTVQLVSDNGTKKQTTKAAFVL